MRFRTLLCGGRLFFESQALSFGVTFPCAIVSENEFDDGAPGTTEQSPRWEGPQANTPRDYMPAKDDPNIDRARNTTRLTDQTNGSKLPRCPS